MATIVLENTKRGEWEIRNEKGNVLCRRSHESKEDAVKWCENYMTSFQINYEIKIIELKR